MPADTGDAVEERLTGVRLGLEARHGDRALSLFIADQRHVAPRFQQRELVGGLQIPHLLADSPFDQELIQE